MRALGRRSGGREAVSCKEMLRELTPFPPALVMRAVVALDRERKEGWDKDVLDNILQAAALDLHDFEERPKAALPTAAVALWAAARPPFSGRLESEQCLLVQAAALRLEVELNESVAMGPSSAIFKPFAQMCAW